MLNDSHYNNENEHISGFMSIKAYLSLSDKAVCGAQN